MVRSARSALALAVSLAAASAPGAARASDTLQPLRVLVYDVAYSTTTVRREHTSGFTNSPGGSTGSVAGSGLVDRRFSTDETGTLTVAIVAATRDGGLAADVTFAGKSARQPTVRVAILADGSLSLDPRHALAPASIRLLPFLARGLVAERSVNPGSSWAVDAPPPATGKTTYRVVAVDGERATIETSSSLTHKGTSAVTEAVEGRTVYETERLAPLSLELRIVTRRDVTSEQRDTIDAHLVATRLSDTFSAHG